MPLDPSATALLTAVQASPRAVAAHDRSAWVDLFTDDARVDDPVGSRPHVGRAAIERFYDTFIAPNVITFQVDQDVVHARTVLRDLTVVTTMSTGATIMVPMHLRYRLVERGGNWKIAHLAAHWELGSMVWQLIRTGLPGLAAGLELGWRLIVQHGLGGVLGMTRALLSVGRRGKITMTRVFTAAANTDLTSVRSVLGHKADIELPVGTSISVEEFTNVARNMQWNKMIASGRTVTASVRVSDARGVAVAEFDADNDRVATLRFYLDAA
ncbi:SgcJ/EcaC family oxidoreductase [Nocardia sp. CNY236]|uniref:SgcJ/EcaC family oxidoreductase n=1 Tax=Nocardia sp. CNY236 TaxID=1169152 RepID=UPI0003FA7FBB|nr:SgcJ/EcaC family oxidoreductase [Nocardia sp. CNY236]